MNRQLFFQAMMDDYAENPRLFILSTHLIQEVENYLTHVIMLKEGQVFLNESIEVVQAKSIKVQQANVSDRNIIGKKQLGSFEEYYLFDDISEDDQELILANGGKLDHYDLQTLFNYLMEV
ncbi:hypothetical protein ACVRWE_04520 [Streptococcus urinalis]|uniref:hypothetical protein n=1 Tax=Streptococcus urinalis TaxID=149016 RepID=UPI000F831559|nr:hypothetical protein [Streptococcus urinalis]